MYASNTKSKVHQKSLKDLIRRAYRGEAIDSASFARIRNLKTEDLTKLRYEIACDLLDELIACSTVTRLYNGDHSRIPLVDLHDEVVSSRLGLDLVEELGTEGARDFLMRLDCLMRAAF